MGERGSRCPEAIGLDCFGAPGLWVGTCGVSAICPGEALLSLMKQMTVFLGWYQQNGRENHRWATKRRSVLVPSHPRHISRHKVDEGDRMPERKNAGGQNK